MRHGGGGGQSLTVWRQSVLNPTVDGGGKTKVRELVGSDHRSEMSKAELNSHGVPGGSVPKEELKSGVLFEKTLKPKKQTH